MIVRKRQGPRVVVLSNLNHQHREIREQTVLTILKGTKNTGTVKTPQEDSKEECIKHLTGD